jgi:hypothetical protein
MKEYSVITNEVADDGLNGFGRFASSVLFVRTSIASYHSLNVMTYTKSLIGFLAARFETALER